MHAFYVRVLSAATILLLVSAVSHAAVLHSGSEIIDFAVKENQATFDAGPDWEFTSDGLKQFGGWE
ncbi:MAG: hypothetical protein ACLFVU_00970 [Phycisphaerae bacterium]